MAENNVQQGSGNNALYFIVGGLVVFAIAAFLFFGGYLGEGADGPADTTLDALVETIAQPYESGVEGQPRRIQAEGPAEAVAGAAVSNLALVIHEFAANAAKYGALSQAGSTVRLTWERAGDTLVLRWAERGGPALAGPPASTGFGTLLSSRVVVDQFGGALDVDWRPDGLVATLAVPLAKLTQ